VATQCMIDAANQHKVVWCDITQLLGPTPWLELIHSFISIWLFKVFVTYPVTVALCEHMG